MNEEPTLAEFLASLDPLMEIQDPSDERLYSSCLARPHCEIGLNHVKFLKALVARNGAKFQAPGNVTSLID